MTEISNQPTPAGRPPWLFPLLAVLLLAGPFGLLVWWAAVWMTEARRPEADLLRFAIEEMTEGDKAEFYRRLAQEVPHLRQAVPEPRVGYTLQQNVTKRVRGAEIRTNGAGMRSSVEYRAKAPGVFRIVCLGDSMVMGTGAPEADRWGDQIAEILHGLGQANVEVLSCGVDGWTAVNAAAYLTSRLSEYDPDLVLVMMLGNDISDGYGVRGDGQSTSAFSPQHRALGSGVMMSNWPNQFGVLEHNLLNAGLGEESRRRYEEVFAGWRRLEQLLAERDARMLFGVLDSHPLFVELCKAYREQVGMDSPMIVTSFFGKRLPHDPHPNREGHGILASHYLHAIAALDWLPVDRARLPVLHDGLELAATPAPDWGRVGALQRQLAFRVPEAIDGATLEPAEVRAFLGGIYPAKLDDRLGSPPYGTPKAALLLRRRDGARAVQVTVEVPARVELFPFELAVHLDGVPSATLQLVSVRDAGEHRITAPIPTGTAGPALDVMLRTDSYWTSIQAPKMFSYRLLDVRQVTH
ncbi:MAG: SGNH/GDSL hydrolase family protein [Planctomycetota bacterium]